MATRDVVLPSPLGRRAGDEGLSLEEPYHFSFVLERLCSAESLKKYSQKFFDAANALTLTLSQRERESDNA